MAFIRVTRWHARRVAALALACAATPATARGQSTEAVLGRVSARSAAAARGVNNYTMELSFLDGVLTVHAERRSPSDPFVVQYGTPGRLGPFMTLLAFTDAVLLELQKPDAATARRSTLSYGGVAASSGAPAHVVTVNFPRRDPQTGAARSRIFTVHYDTATLLPRRMEMSTVNAAGGPMRTTIDYSDYRPVDGHQIPFQRRIVTSGVRAGTDTARVRTTLNVLRAGVDQEPAAEREQTRRLIAQLEGVLERDELVNEITVTSARVNQGAPTGVRLERVEPLDPPEASSRPE